MNNNAYITCTGKHYYVLLTGKRRITVNMICSFLRKIAEVQNISAEKWVAIIKDRDACREMRKRIDPCRYEERTGAAGNYHHIEVGNIDRPSTVINCPTAENAVVIFTEDKVNRRLAEILEEAEI